ncbi:hypothetical protein B484DRAFT_290166 [Ochromonadaceae sp. CCMP2298]|nr:hypothetical protein B484DRAFT_290166 [Ochromonadaceae sp. CCMP2298]
MLLCGEEAAGMVDSLGRINQAAFACTGGLQNPLAPQLHRQRSPKTLQEKQVEALSKLPAYRLKHICITTDGGGGFLTLVTNRTIEAGTITPTGATLTSIQLVQQETDDEMFVCGVSVFNEGLYQETGSDEAVVDVHREALRLLTGEEGVKVRVCVCICICICICMCMFCRPDTLLHFHTAVLLRCYTSVLLYRRTAVLPLLRTTATLPPPYPATLPPLLPL